MERKHAILSPSAAHRWMNCTAAPMLEKDVEDKGSVFAEEGTLAHAYCAKKLKKFLKLDTSGEEIEISALNDKYHTGEMDEYTDNYKVIVLEKFNAARKRTRDARLLVEVRLDFSRYVPEAFGTSDAIIIADGVMEVIDFKYGKGVRVSATENPQMMIYALGAWDAFNFEYDIRKVRMTIVQPRIDNMSEYELTAEELKGWAEKKLMPKAKEAYNGGKQKPGGWCQFCKVKASCKALADLCTGVAKESPDLKLITKENMESAILPLLPVFKTWLTGVEEYALGQALSGVQYKGFKVVEGRSVRKITDPAAVMRLLGDAGFKEDAYIRPTELRSITDLEKNIGKKRFGELCREYINKPQGKPALVPETDKRPAINTAEEDFKDIN